MKTRRSKLTLWTILGIIVVIVLGVVIFFQSPYSKTRHEFDQAVTDQIDHLSISQEVFTTEDMEGLPAPVRHYFTYSGYLGKPKMSYMKAAFKDVDFIMSPDKPAISIDYTQFNFAHEPIRLAFIDTTLYGIPFQGLDSYVHGKGSMLGVLAKGFTLFHQTGEEMNKAALVTFLSESLMIPSAALQPYIVWESIDDTHAKATISYDGCSASGVFAFDADGKLLTFTTEDRFLISPDGTYQQVTWFVRFDEYELTNGIKQPTHLQAIWKFSDKDLIYFDSHEVSFDYDQPL
ncbi:DUF6544 family protein [Paenibacillus sp. 1001270B_150601_E10]|uniref:DUF6544 family protein n=1 Tax=Paenibacillus sp. 1001270B_150601_E10 TaxID=2787079 RepID=UPI0018A03F46|nr:DUF6544 family protein [Paenibacillus sp. 1001270B_150601_E10]